MGALSSQQFGELERQVATALEQAGFHIDSTRPIDYGISLLLSGGGMVNLYNGKKGPTAVPVGKLLQADKARLLTALGQVHGLDSAASGGKGGSDTTAAAGNVHGFRQPWIGCDESGKGDYFGPLVVAAVAARPDQVDTIVKAGVRDSKTLSDAAALRVSGWIERELPHAVRILMPVEYNRRYQDYGNLNTMLSDLHAEVIAELGKAHAITAAVSDRFGNPARIEQSLRAAGVAIRLISVTKAEADAAVAAASVLARGLFLQALTELSQEATVALPPGAGPQVIQAGRELVSLFGAATLSQYAKMHFKTTQNVTG